MANPNVGMLHPVWAPITAEGSGGMPTYGTGMVIGEGRTATVTREYANNPLYGDDRIVDDDNGMTGLTISFESTGLTDNVRKSMLGEADNVNTTTGGQWVSDDSTPWGGLGFVRVMRLNGVRKFEAWLTIKIKFQEESMATQTREGQITWGTPTLNGRAAGLITDATNKQHFQLHKTFDTSATAAAWLDGILNVPTSN